MHASMHIPFYMTHIEKVKKCYAIDGGFTKNISIIDDNTITISPTMRSAHIKPNNFLSLKECFAPTNNNRLKEIFELGKNDCNKYFSNNHSIKKYNPKKSKNIIKTLFKYFLCTNFWIFRFIEQYGFKNIIAIFIVVLYIFRRYIHSNKLLTPLNLIKQLFLK